VATFILCVLEEKFIMEEFSDLILETFDGRQIWETDRLGQAKFSSI
jgi:hypothetical protein